MTTITRTTLVLLPPEFSFSLAPLLSLKLVLRVRLTLGGTDETHACLGLSSKDMHAQGVRVNRESEIKIK